MKISVILPTYNEKEGIFSLIEAIHRELSIYHHEIIVVDDNSPDGTYNAVMNADLPYTRAILRTKDRGLAKSIRCGIKNATGDVFVVMDSDFNHQPSYLPFMIQSLSHYECVTASRFLYGGSMNNRTRHYLSWLFNIFVRFTTGRWITDSLYGYLAIKRESMEKLNYDDIFWGYGDYCIRLMYYLQKQKANILQIPAVNGERRHGQGNSSFLGVFMQYTRETLKLVFKERIMKRCTKR
jgi:dolichol-phosphate mannosyltransferase